MSLDDKIEIKEVASLESDNPTILIGLPDVGLVGIVSAMHLINILEMKEVAYVESDLLPPMIFIHNGRINDPVRVYNKGDLVLVTSEVPVPTGLVKPLIRSIIKWSKKKNPKLIATLGGIPTPNRGDIEKPEIYSLSTDEEAQKHIEKLNLQKMMEGIMVGPYPVVLREAQKNKLPAVAFLAQAFSRYPDPGAAASVIEVVGNLLGIDVNVDELLKSEEEIRVKTRDLMRRTDRTMQQMGKTQELEVPAMYS